MQINTFVNLLTTLLAVYNLHTHVAMIQYANHT